MEESEDVEWHIKYLPVEVSRRKYISAHLWEWLRFIGIKQKNLSTTLKNIQAATEIWIKRHATCLEKK